MSSSRQDRGTPRVIPWMLAVAAVAAIVRVIYVVEVSGHPLQMVATADPLAYDLRALEILGGKWISPEVFFHSSPIYPYMLAGIYAVFGHSYLAVRLLQSAVGVGTSLLLFSTARAMFGLREGVAAGLMAALYVAFVFFDSELLMITFVVFFSVLAVWLLLRHERRPSAWVVFAAGLCTGLAALGKPNVLLFVPPVLVWFWRSPRPESRRGRRFSPMIAFVAATVLVIAPFTISNYRASGRFVLTTSNGGINFHIGHNEHADGTFIVDQSMRGDLYAGSKKVAEREVGRSLDAAEVSSHWLRKGLSYAGAHPLRELELLGRKFLLFWNAYEIPNHYDLNFFKTFSKVLRYDPVLFAWMVPLGFLGIYVSRKRWREHVLLYTFAGTYMLSLLPFFISSRYRLPVVPVMIVFAARGFWWVVERARTRERRGWTAALAVLVAALVLVNFPLVDFTFGPSYAILGAVYRDTGRHEEAAEQFRRAAEESPGYDLAFSNLSAELARLGRFGEAETAAREALRLNPLLVPAHSNLGLVCMQMGRPEEARRAFMRAVELDPEHKEAWSGLAQLGMAAGDAAAIERALQRIVDIDPRDGFAHWNLAVLYSEDPGRRDDSARHARAAAEYAPQLRSEVGRLLAALREEASGE
ncbi:MAG: tetratricopeptide repeat protein [Candidatus Eisenbacteria bacterium]